MKAIPQKAARMAGLFAFLLSVTFALAFTPHRNFATTTLYFDGNPLNSGQVTDEARWAEDNPSSSCEGSNQACAMTVDLEDVTGPSGSRVLNSARIGLGANGNSTAGYNPYKSGGTSPHDITAINKN